MNGDVRAGGDADRDRAWWVPHLVGVSLGILVILGMWGLAGPDAALMDTAVRRAEVWAFRAQHSLHMVVGVVVAVVIITARRLPALPTTLAVCLLYATAASPVLNPVGHHIPSLGPWLPRPFRVVGSQSTLWDGTLLPLFAGAMTAAAVWGWWGYRRDRRP